MKNRQHKNQTFNRWRIEFDSVVLIVNPKGGGGGLKVPAGQEIACHFSQDHTVVTKILDFIHKHPNQKVVKSFFHYLDRFFRNLAETNQKLGFFGIENHKIDFFFNCFITKSSNFISNMNDNFYEASFEVYYIFVRQKLVILGFLPKIFFALTLVTSETS